MKGYREIGVALALTAFSGQAIKVVHAAEVEKEVDGQLRKVMATEEKPLSEEGVLSAKQYEDGTVTITTIDGKRHIAKGKLKAADADAGGEDKGKAKK